MTLDQLGNLGEFFGAIGVVISFVFLAIQIRHNAKATRGTGSGNSTRNTGRVSEESSSGTPVSLAFGRGGPGRNRVSTRLSSNSSRRNTPGLSMILTDRKAFDAAFGCISRGTVRLRH